MKFWGAFFAFSLFAFSSGATTFRPISFEEQVRNSDELCAFEVKTKQTELIRETVYTIYELDTLECFKGSLATGTLIRLEVIGGTEKKSESKKRRMSFVPGAPRFEVGSSYVLSLSKNQSSYALEDWSSLPVQKEGSEYFVVSRSQKSRELKSGLGSMEQGRFSFNEFRMRVLNAMNR